MVIFYSVYVDIHQWHVAGMAEISGVQEVHEAGDGQPALDLRPAVVDSVHDGPGQRHQAAT